MCSLSPDSFSLITFLPKYLKHSNKNKEQGVKKKKKKSKVVHMSKSIKNDADIMLLISQHFNKVSATESDTVFCVTSKERKLHKPRLWASMDLVKVQTGTSFDIHL